MLVPHENLAVAMAHGVYLMNGHPQAVMVHTTAGTANTLNNLFNLARDRVPLILAAGRTPITEKGSFGSRTPADPVGPGNVRPGRHAARDGQVGLRIARAGADRRRGGARGGSGDGASARARLSHAAARAAGRLDRADRPGAPAPAGRQPACRPGRARQARRLDRVGRAPAHPRRPIAGQRRARAQRILPSAAPFRSWSAIRARSACRRAIRCISASSRPRCSPTPTW